MKLFGESEDCFLVNSPLGMLGECGGVSHEDNAEESGLYIMKIGKN